MENNVSQLHLNDKFVKDKLIYMEMTIVNCAIKGLNNLEISDIINISERSVKNYLTRIYKKAGFSHSRPNINRTKLAIRYLPYLLDKEEHIKDRLIKGV